MRCKILSSLATCTLLLAIGTLFLSVLTGCSNAPRPSGKQSGSLASPAAQSPAPLAGTASCTSRGCHGALIPSEPADSPSRHSYTLWQFYDPHAGAYQALFGDRATQIGSHLKIENVTDEPTCLACHTNPRATGQDNWARADRNFGVGCESCHGAANDWLLPHRDASWREMTLGDKVSVQLAHKMTPLGSLPVRAETCAGCHVGAPASAGIPARDVNHDLIAAGHPRLMFEFGAFQANLPKHWKERHKNADPDFEARSWLIGQIASARSSLELLVAHRANPNSGAVWPEFAACDCRACHHDLRDETWRQDRQQSGRSALRADSWYPTLLPSISKFAGEPQLSLQPWEDLARQVSRPSDNQRNAAAALLNVLTDLLTRLDRQSLTYESCTRLRITLAEQGLHHNDPDWEELEQLALALVAVQESIQELRCQEKQPPDERRRSQARAIEELLKRLALPPNSSTPPNFRHDPEFDKDLRKLFTTLSDP